MLAIITQWLRLEMRTYPRHSAPLCRPPHCPSVSASDSDKHETLPAATAQTLAAESKNKKNEGIKQRGEEPCSGTQQWQPGCHGNVSDLLYLL